MKNFTWYVIMEGFGANVWYSAIRISLIPHLMFSISTHLLMQKVVRISPSSLFQTLISLHGPLISRSLRSSLAIMKFVLRAISLQRNEWVLIIKDCSSNCSLLKTWIDVSEATTKQVSSNAIVFTLENNDRVWTLEGPVLYLQKDVYALLFPCLILPVFKDLQSGEELIIIICT